MYTLIEVLFTDMMYTIYYTTHTIYDEKSDCIGEDWYCAVKNKIKNETKCAKVVFMLTQSRLIRQTLYFKHC